MARQKENVFLNLGINVVLPSILLMKLGDFLPISPLAVLGISLLPPLLYGLWDVWKRKKYNFFSILGLVSIILTGGLGLLQLSGIWLAIKEASIPLLIGIVIASTAVVGKPLFATLLKEILAYDKLHQRLELTNNQSNYQKMLNAATFALAGTLVFSAVMNFFIARSIVVSEAGSPQFNQELAQMNLISYPMIVIPSFIMIAIIMYVVMTKLTKYTGVQIEELLLEEGK